MRIIRDILDKQVVDRDDERLGRVDGIIVELRPDEPPRVHRLELGWMTIADRVHPSLATLVERLHRRWSVRRSFRSHVDWDKVLDHDVHCVRVDLCAAESSASDWERWFRRHVVEKLPGGKPKE